MEFPFLGICWSNINVLQEQRLYCKKNFKRSQCPATTPNENNSQIQTYCLPGDRSTNDIWYNSELLRRLDETDGTIDVFER